MPAAKARLSVVPDIRSRPGPGRAPESGGGHRLKRGRQSRLCRRPPSQATVRPEKRPRRLSAAVVTGEIEFESKNGCLSPDSTRRQNLPGRAAPAYHAIADRSRQRPRRKAIGCRRHRPGTVGRSRTSLRPGPGRSSGCHMRFRARLRRRRFSAARNRLIGLPDRATGRARLGGCWSGGEP